MNNYCECHSLIIYLDDATNYFPLLSRRIISSHSMSNVFSVYAFVVFSQDKDYVFYLRCRCVEHYCWHTVIPHHFRSPFKSLWAMPLRSNFSSKAVRLLSWCGLVSVLFWMRCYSLMGTLTMLISPFVTINVWWTKHPFIVSIKI